LHLSWSEEYAQHLLIHVGAFNISLWPGVTGTAQARGLRIRGAWEQRLAIGLKEIEGRVTSNCSPSRFNPNRTHVAESNIRQTT
jgi:hypothetical protein